MGAPPGGPGGEAEELVSGGSAHGLHTVPHRQRKGEVFYVSNRFCSPFNSRRLRGGCRGLSEQKRFNIDVLNNLCIYLLICTSKVHTCLVVAG